MTRTQFALAGAFLALASLLTPFGNSMAAQDNNDRGSNKAAGALTLPIAGSVTGGGAFNGTVTINRFAKQNGQLVAVGFVRGTITDASGGALETGLRSITLPVSLGTASGLTSTSTSSEAAGMTRALFTGATGGRWMRVQATCGVLHLELGPVALNLLGFNVNLSPVTLDISGDSAGPLGGLVCQVIALLNTVVDVVGLLNSILGLLTGLLGGLTGGLGA